MKRWMAVLAAMMTLVGCNRMEKQEETPTFVPSRIIATYLTMIEKPTATRCLIAGTRSETYREFFERAGLTVDDLNHAKGKYDIVLVAGDTKGDVARVAGKHLSGNGVLSRIVDIRNKTMDELKAEFEELTAVLPKWHLWMTGIEDWVVIGRINPAKVKLSSMMEVFSREGGFDDLSAAECESLPELFANYVGVDEAVMPAFGNMDGSTPARPQFFVTQEVPVIDWVDADDGVDDDVLEEVIKEVRSMQMVRRVVLEGGILADAQKIDEATDAWARAARRNPHDPMLIDRLERLWKNADAFFRVGNFPLAAKCYETYLMIRPNDWQSAEALAFCLEQLGQRELAGKVHEKAMRLRDGDAAK